MADNGSDDGAPEAARARYDHVSLLHTGGNIGYGGAVNRAVAEVDPAIEYVIVANPDVEWAPGSIDRLLDAADRWPRAGALGPLIREPDGTSIRRRAGSRIWSPEPGMRSWERCGSPTPGPRRTGRTPSTCPNGAVGWLSGSCLLVRREAFDSIGGFDSRYFMYMEDVDLGDRLGRAGWLNVFVPDAEVCTRKAMRPTVIRNDVARAPSQRLSVPGRPAPALVAGAVAARPARRARGTVGGGGCGGQTCCPPGRFTRRLDDPTVPRKVQSDPDDGVTPRRCLTDDVQAVILVGGKGTRLRPLTLSAPKPMLPTAGVPFLTHLLARIKAAGIKQVVLGTSFKSEVFEQHFGDGSKMGLSITYVHEAEPMGTGGGIRNVLGHLTAETILVFNGDVLVRHRCRAPSSTPIETSGAEVTLHLVRVGDPRAFGCVPTDETAGSPRSSRRPRIRPPTRSMPAATSSTVR